MIFREKCFSCYILLGDQVSLSGYLYFLGFWAICELQLFITANSAIHFGSSYIFGQCWYWWLLNSSIIWKVNFNTCSFLRCFFLTCKLYMAGLYIIPYFGHGQCSIWGFLVVTFITNNKCKSNHYLFQWFFAIWEWQNSGL